MKLIKTISFLSIMAMGISTVSHAAPMTAQIQRLLQEKEEKIKQLEQCDSKRKGWMIAGVSTIGLTAVGVGVNIAQASKSNKLSGEIDSAKQELDRYEYKLSDINARISDKEREKAEKAKDANDTPAGESGDEIESQIDTSPELDSNPKIGDKCNDGAGIWVEKAGALGVCIKEPDGKTPCECVSDANSTEPKIDESPLKDKPKEPTVKPDARVVGDGCLKTDLPIGATKGHYITFGINNLDCVDKAGESVKCACAAQVCDESNGYELVRDAQGNSQGRCQKSKASNSTKSESVSKTGGANDSKTVSDSKPVNSDKNETGSKQIENNKSVEQINKPVDTSKSVPSPKNKSNDSSTTVKLKGVDLPSSYATVVYNYRTNCTTQKSGMYVCSNKNDIAGICSYLGGQTKSAADYYYCDCPNGANDCKKVFWVTGNAQIGHTGSGQLDASVNGENYCYYNIDGSNKYESGCKVSKPGDWGVKFSYGTVSGVSACSDLSGSYATESGNQQRVESAYTSKATSNPTGKNCYCKMTNPSSARWVFGSSLSDASDCALNCPNYCAAYVRNYAGFRGAVFGASAQ